MSFLKLARISIAVLVVITCHVRSFGGQTPTPQGGIGFDQYICTFLDSNKAGYAAAHPSSNLTGDLIAGAAIDQARFFAAAYKKAPKAGFGGFQEAYRKNADRLAALATKGFRDGATIPEREAVGEVRTALYIDTAIALVAAGQDSKANDFQTALREHRESLGIVAHKNWRTETLSEPEEADVCLVLKAYSKK